MTVEADRDATRNVTSSEHGIDVLLGIVVFGRIIILQILGCCTKRCELVEQPVLARELEAQYRPPERIDAIAVCMLDDVSEQRSQHRRVLEVEEL